MLLWVGGKRLATRRRHFARIRITDMLGRTCLEKGAKEHGDRLTALIGRKLVDIPPLEIFEGTLHRRG